MNAAIDTRELPDIPRMVEPSGWTTAVFVGIVLTLCVLFVLATARARAPGESARSRRSWVLCSAAGVVAWLAITALVPLSGILERKMLPPPALLFVASSLAVALAVAFSPLGSRLVQGVPVSGLIGFQAFRLPLEVVLHEWWGEGVLPVQMTFQGHNFDIVTGVLAVVVGLWAWRLEPSRAVVLGFNVLGSALLVAVATIALLSAPLPLRRYMNDPPVLLPFNFPYAWIIPFCVGGALLGHLLVFRWASASPQSGSSPPQSQYSR